MYDKQYHDKATLCIMTHIKHSTGLPTPNTAYRVSAMRRRYIRVAANRCKVNMFFSCCTGPTRKAVLPSDNTLPNV